MMAERMAIVVKLLNSFFFFSVDEIVIWITLNSKILLQMLLIILLVFLNCPPDISAKMQSQSSWLRQVISIQPTC